VHSADLIRRASIRVLASASARPNFLDASRGEVAMPSRIGWLAAILFVCAAGQAAAQTPAEAVDRSAFRVCADPGNLPYSNEAGEGFENRIAALFAAKLGVPVRYTWYPDSFGFIRNTLRARRCDIVMGTSTTNELLQNTNPYYRSTFVFVYRKDAGYEIASFDDAVLKDLKIGVIAGTAPTTVMARKGLLTNIRSYQLLVDTRIDHPALDMLHDVASGAIDVAILWGPIAGYTLKTEALPLAMVPARAPDLKIQLDYRITMGVRANEPMWKREINTLIRDNQAGITRILLDYGVPLIDEQGNLVTAVP
jgi:quinoprotein dehydrogenase-associated probable ABC transporter substrate-binding protein